MEATDDEEEEEPAVITPQKKKSTPIQKEDKREEADERCWHTRILLQEAASPGNQAGHSGQSDAQ